jgi:hypothetical protein
VAVEVERDGSIDIRAIGSGSRFCQAPQSFAARQAEWISRPYGNDGECRFGRTDQFGRGCIRAAVVSHLEQVRAGMKGGHAALYLLFGVSFGTDESS